MNNQAIIEKLQNEAKQFLTETKLMLNGVSIMPKEIEVYYYKKGGFEDTSVHRNELQQKNKNHFYVHRRGTKQSDKYIGGNRGGLDFVVSDDKNTFYSYLIRSAVIGKDMVIGPHKVLERILKHCNLKEEAVESELVELIPNSVSDDVLFSKRINLGKKAGQFIDCELRAILCDESYVQNKFPAKEKPVVDFLMDKIRTQNMSKERAVDYAKQKLGYVPSAIKQFQH